MDRTIKKYLHDILLAIEEIEFFLTQRPRQYQVYLDDLMFKRAIERNVSIIGEAMSKILQIDADIAITNAKNIKGTRNYGFMLTTPSNRISSGTLSSTTYQS